MSPEPERVAPQVRANLSQVFREEFSVEYLRELIREVKGSTKGVKADVTCRECGQRQYVFVQLPDYDKILLRAVDVLEQTEGRPGVLPVEEVGVTLVVERTWPASS